MANPYSGQEPYETAWNLGHEYGLQNPTADNPTPPDFSSWGLDDATRGYVEQVWREGALAGREESAGGGGGGSGSGDGGMLDLPYYDAATDTLYASSEEFPALVYLAQSGDIDTWLRGLDIDAAIFSDDEPVA